MKKQLLGGVKSDFRLLALYPQAAGKTHSHPVSFDMSAEPGVRSPQSANDNDCPATPLLLRVGIIVNLS